jgi:cytochrome c553
MLKTSLAERILKSAAEGERNGERLSEAALRDLAAYGNKIAPPMSTRGQKQTFEPPPPDVRFASESGHGDLAAKYVL